MRYIILLIALSLQLLLPQRSWSSSPSSEVPRHLAIARSYIGTQELPGNRGKWIDAWNRFVSNPLGSPYCAAFGSKMLDSADVKSPKIKTGLAAKFRTKNSISAWKIINGKAKVKQGMIALWQKGKTIFGHFGFADKDWDGIAGETVEANTSPNNSGNQRDGNGIWSKYRRIEPYNYFRIVSFTPVFY